MKRDPREGWEPKGFLRKAHQLALECDYSDCFTIAQENEKYEFYFGRIARRLLKQKVSYETKKARAKEDLELLMKLEAKRKADEESMLEELGIDPDEVDESTLPEEKEMFYEPLGLKSESYENIVQVVN